MTLNWTAFTPASALAGGALIGLAAALLILLGGRIAGISGILGGLLRRVPGERAWRAAFIGGLVVSPWMYAALAAPLAPRIEAGWPTLLAAGLIVGIGTRYGAGCTSGHGVCGLSRLSWRSAVATATFMAAGFATVFVARHLF
ncbi:MAG: YeeE/YedE family protein [Pelomonas sp.]|nr:YeeE/YedE family protein [Roseateles sp.]